VALRPSVARQRVVELAPEQELGDPRSAAHQVDAQVLARAHEISQLLLGRLGHAHEAQLSREQQSCQPDRVTLVGLDPVDRRADDVAGGADDDVEPSRLGRPGASPYPVGPAS
jgi:hypothetical protein